MREVIEACREQSDVIQNIESYLRTQILSINATVTSRGKDIDDPVFEIAIQRYRRMATRSLISYGRIAYHMVLVKEKSGTYLLPEVIPGDAYVIYLEKDKIIPIIMDAQYENKLKKRKFMIEFMESPRSNGMVVSPVGRSAFWVVGKLRLHEASSFSDLSNLKSMMAAVKTTNPNSVTFEDAMAQGTMDRIDPPSDKTRQADEDAERRLREKQHYSTTDVASLNPSTSLLSTTPLRTDVGIVGGFDADTRLTPVPFVPGPRDIINRQESMDEAVYRSFGFPNLDRLNQGGRLHADTEYQHQQLQKRVREYAEVIEMSLTNAMEVYNDYYTKKRGVKHIIFTDIGINFDRRNQSIDRIPIEDAFRILSKIGRREHLKFRFGLRDDEIADCLDVSLNAPTLNLAELKGVLSDKAFKEYIAKLVGVDTKHVRIPEHLRSESPTRKRQKSDSSGEESDTGNLSDEPGKKSGAGDLSDEPARKRKKPDTGDISDGEESISKKTKNRKSRLKQPRENPDSHK